MIDIHSHIIPGIDDGPESIEEAVEMADAAAREGIDTIIATPHYMNGVFCSNPGTNRRLAAELQSHLDSRGIKVKLLPGNEIYMTPELPDLLTAGKAATLADSGYVLVELPFGSIPFYTDRIIFKLGLQGKRVIFAHPERNICLMENPKMAMGFIRLGALIQVNASSITGEYGRKVRKAAIFLLEHNMVHFIGTDAHSSKWRTPGIRNAVEEMEKRCSEKELQRILYDNPRRLLKNEQIWAPETGASEKKGVFSFISCQ